MTKETYTINDDAPLWELCEATALVTTPQKTPQPVLPPPNPCT